MTSFKKITQELRKPDTCYFFNSIDDLEKRTVTAKNKTWVLNDQPEEVPHNREKNRKKMKS